MNISLSLSVPMCHVMVIISRAPILSSGELESQYRSSSIISSISKS